jgi:hypothetical protein
MHEYINTTIPLGMRCHCNGARDGGSRCPIGDINKERIKSTRHAIDSSQQVVQASLCLWRKEFKGIEKGNDNSIRSRGFILCRVSPILFAPSINLVHYASHDDIR